MERAICRHCRANAVNRPRGLCWHCYYTPGVKDLHPSTSKYARRGTPNFCHAARSTFPVAWRPGTSEKVAEMERRAAEGEELFHPLDGRVEA